MTFGVIVELTEHYIAAPFVERAGLERVGVEAHRMATAFGGVGFGQVHQLGGPALAASRLVDPQVGDVQPAAPDGAQQATHRLAARVLQEEVNRVVGRQAGHADIEHVEAVAHQLRVGAADLVKDDLVVG